MSKSREETGQSSDLVCATRRPISRKNFFKFSGLSAASFMALSMYGCQDSGLGVLDNKSGGNNGSTDKNADVVKLGAGDIGILNFAYALEQLEAAYYIQVLENPYHNMSSDEGRILEALREHEVAHADFYKAALGDNAIRGLEVDFSSVDFDDCASVLNTAQVFEDLGVSAYNGAGQLLEDTELLLVAGKIVSVEARHAAAIRDLLKPRTGFFAGDDVIDENGLDVV
ncbi:MAG: ferritin-like domain-containing protein, partial [Balneolaceae bacterium]